jgi:hypothetical protein
MNGTMARMFFLGVCIIIAILLLTHVVTIIVGGIIFAVALAVLGGCSKGFRKA